MRILLEVCVDDPAGVAAARAGGADRLELCAALALGGLTPSPGLVRAAAEAGLPGMAMIRPRAGDFVWDAAEMRAMEAEIAAMRALGAAGVVIGANRPDGRLDAAALARLMAAAAGLDVTLHRAVDLAPDPVAAVDTARGLGIRRILSSGGAATAVEGAARLAAMHRAGGVTIMPGAGVAAETLGPLRAALPLTEVHASCSRPLPPPGDPRIMAFGFRPPGARGTDAGRVAALRRALDQAGSPAIG